MNNTLFALTLVVSAFVIALSVLLAFGLIDRRRSRPPETVHRRGTRPGRVHLRERDPARRHPGRPSAARLGPAQGHRLGAPRHAASPRFPRLGELIGDLAEVGEMRLARPTAPATCAPSGMTAWPGSPSTTSTRPTASRRVRPAQPDGADPGAEDPARQHRGQPVPAMARGRPGRDLLVQRGLHGARRRVSADDDVPPWPPARVFNLADRRHCRRTDGARHGAPLKIGRKPSGTGSR